MQHTFDGTLPYYYLRQLRPTFESRLQIRRMAMLKSLGAKYRQRGCPWSIAKTFPTLAFYPLQNKDISTQPSAPQLVAQIAMAKRSSNWCRLARPTLEGRNTGKVI